MLYFAFTHLNGSIVSLFEENCLRSMEKVLGRRKKDRIRLKHFNANQSVEKYFSVSYRMWSNIIYQKQKRIYCKLHVSYSTISSDHF